MCVFSLNSSSRYGPPVRTEHRIIVENLSSRISWQVSYRLVFFFYTSFSYPVSYCSQPKFLLKPS